MRFALLPAEIEVPALRPERDERSPAAARFDLRSPLAWWRKTTCHGSTESTPSFHSELALRDIEGAGSEQSRRAHHRSKLQECARGAGFRRQSALVNRAGIETTSGRARPGMLGALLEGWIAGSNPRHAIDYLTNLADSDIFAQTCETSPGTPSTSCSSRKCRTPRRRGGQATAH